MKNSKSQKRLILLLIISTLLFLAQLINAQSLLRVTVNYDELGTWNRLLSTPNQNYIDTIRITLSYSINDVSIPTKAEPEMKQGIFNSLFEGKNIYLMLKEINNSDTSFVKGYPKVIVFYPSESGAKEKRYEWIDYIDFYVSVNAMQSCNPQLKILIDQGTANPRKVISRFDCTTPHESTSSKEILNNQNQFAKPYIMEPITKSTSWDTLISFGLGIVAAAAASYFYKESWDNYHSKNAATDQVSKNNFQSLISTNKTMYYVTGSVSISAIAYFLYKRIWGE